MEENQDPEAYLAVARRQVRFMESANPLDFDRWALLAEANLLEGRACAAHGASPLTLLAQAEREIKEGLAGQPNSVYMMKIALEIYLDQSEWLLNRGEKAQETLDSGLQLARQALLIRPRDAHLYGLQGALLTVASEIDANPALRAEALASLRTALERNHYVSREFSPYLERARVPAD